MFGYVIGICNYRGGGGGGINIEDFFKVVVNII